VQLEPERAGGGAGGDRGAVAGEVEAGAVGVGTGQYPVATARDEPRHRRAVALRDAANRKDFGRAVGAGVAAVGAELDAAAALVEGGVVADAEAREVLARTLVPVQRQTVGAALGTQLQLDQATGRKLDR